MDVLVRRGLPPARRAGDDALGSVITWIDDVRGARKRRLVLVAAGLEDDR